MPGVRRGDRGVVCLHRSRRRHDPLPTFRRHSDYQGRGTVGISSPQRILNERIKALEAAGVLGPDLVKACHDVRVHGNQATHERHESIRRALLSVQDCFELGRWWHHTTTGEREERVFVPPEPAQMLLRAGDKMSSAVKEIELVLAAYRRRLVEHEQHTGETLTIEQAEDLATELMGVLRDNGERLRGLGEQFDARFGELRSAFESRLADLDHMPEAARVAHFEHARLAAKLAAAEGERLVATARQLLAEGALGAGERSAAAVNVAGAGSSNVVIGGFYGGTFNQARREVPAGEQP